MIKLLNWSKIKAKSLKDFTCKNLNFLFFLFVAPLLFNSIKLSQCSKLYNSRLQKLHHLLLNPYCKFSFFVFLFLFFSFPFFSFSLHKSILFPATLSTGLALGIAPPDEHKHRVTRNLIVLTSQISPNIVSVHIYSNQWGGKESIADGNSI